MPNIHRDLIVIGSLLWGYGMNRYTDASSLSMLYNGCQSGGTIPDCPRRLAEVDCRRCRRDCYLMDPKEYGLPGLYVVYLGIYLCWDSRRVSESNG